MTTTTITTRRDLDNWLYDAGDLDDDDRARVADRIQAGDHPAWGADWTEFLAGLDLAALAIGGDEVAWSVGDHIAGGHGEDRDLGAIIAIDGDRVTVAWRWSESRTVESLADLRARLASGGLQAWDGHASDEDAECACAECAAHREASA